MRIETDDYITTKEMSEESGQPVVTVTNWLRYHHYMDFENIFDRKVVLRADWNQFKADHPELINPEPLTKREEYAETASRG